MQASTIRFIDANIFLSRWDDAAARDYLETLDPEKDYTSVTVLGEVYHVLTRKGVDDVFRLIRRLMAMTTVLEVTQDDLFNAVKNPIDIEINDKISIAVMRRNGIDTILSYDKGFDQDKTIKRIGL
ncbi:TPA: type II toxin-antitoxin system VapC family toxin [Candidatus Woesearchaeota archaeon]|nr:type II toxin-antitoxin system VapC family toxin [Candidatus Woesearchaeota archaeon]